MTIFPLIRRALATIDETRKHSRKHHIWLQTGAMLGVLAVMIWK